MLILGCGVKKLKPPEINPSGLKVSIGIFYAVSIKKADCVKPSALQIFYPNFKYFKNLFSVFFILIQTFTTILTVCIGAYYSIDKVCIQCVYYILSEELMNSRKIIKELKKNGWELVNCVGSHKQFKHPKIKGRVTVPHPKRDINIKTLKSIEKQSGLKF